MTRNAVILWEKAGNCKRETGFFFVKVTGEKESKRVQSPRLRLPSFALLHDAVGFIARHRTHCVLFVTRTTDA